MGSLEPHIGSKTAPQIIFLQETAFKKHEWISYQKVALRNGYHAFFSGSHEISGTRQASGGATVLVRASLPVRPAWHCTSKGGAAQAVWVAGRLMVSVYLAPNFASRENFQDVSAKILSLPPEQQWFMGGDFNATPQECPFRYSLQTVHLEFNASGCATRCFHGTPETPAIVLSDHKVQELKLEFSAPAMLSNCDPVLSYLLTKVTLRIGKRRFLRFGKDTSNLCQLAGPRTSTVTGTH